MNYIGFPEDYNKFICMKKNTFIFGVKENKVKINYEFFNLKI